MTTSKDIQSSIKTNVREDIQSSLKTNVIEDIKYLYDRGMFAMKLGLENIESLLDYAKIEIDKLKTIHVAGTNGKGSTSNMLSQILTANGYTVGLFTSPHLVSFNERFKINGKMISDKELADSINFLKSGIEKFNCTFFEASTAIAFKYFIDNNVDVAIIEAGLGGRMDSTNVLTPVLSVITGIDYDHTAHLGNSIVEIAREKAGIIKKGIPIVFNVDKLSAKKMIVSTAKKKKSRILEVDKKVCKFKNGKVEFNIRDQIFNSTFNLIGNYQKENFRTVVAALKAVRESFPVKADRTISAIKSFIIKGRMEVVSEKPFIMIDAAHNIQGLNELKKYVQDLKVNKVHLVTGTVKDKDHIGTIKNILSFKADKYFVGSNNPRILPIEDFKKVCNNSNINESINYYENVVDGYKAALKNYKENDMILITGSHFILGDFLEGHEAKLKK
ncbi:MAG: bifunctional folylpolyglutamate synthase/dihydrofolate synthase [Candidatus Delongbacteria bacterium]|jgi:dihydrofolate synthase/folylpolyglutamate synthase|nr:bifunctional folylpolyglutamate synthase/dihydrofolate synthase [Candidatus Delongbacteria bacterium]